VRLGFAVLGGLLAVAVAIPVALARSDGPVLVFRGGPFRTGEPVAFERVDWLALDDALDLEIELVGARTSLTLWFSVSEGTLYVACDLDCEGGMLTRWPSEVARDDRVVVRIDGRRVEGRLRAVPHGTEEYRTARARRLQKYSGTNGTRAGAESAAHDAVVEVGEVLTGRASRDEPGDRLFRLDPR